LDRTLRVGFEGAKLDEPEPAVRRKRIPKFVDANLGAVSVAAAIHQQIAEKQIVEREVLRGAERLGGGTRDLQFVESFVGGLVDARRLRTRAHVSAREA